LLEFTERIDENTPRDYVSEYAAKRDIVPTPARLSHQTPAALQAMQPCIDTEAKVLDSRANNHRAAASPFSTTSVCPALPMAAPKACVRNANPRVFSITV